MLHNVGLMLLESWFDVTVVMVRPYMSYGSMLQNVGLMLLESWFDVTVVMVRCYINDGSTLQELRFDVTIITD